MNSDLQTSVQNPNSSHELDLYDGWLFQEAVQAGFASVDEWIEWSEANPVQGCEFRPADLPF